MLKRFVSGLLWTCLVTLVGCANVQPSVGQMPTVSSCPKLVPCVLTASSVKTNGDLNLLIDQVEADWAICAAQVDAIVVCQKDDTDA